MRRFWTLPLNDGLTLAQHVQADFDAGMEDCEVLAKWGETHMLRAKQLANALVRGIIARVPKRRKRVAILIPATCDCCKRDFRAPSRFVRRCDPCKARRIIDEDCIEMDMRGIGDMPGFDDR